MVRLLLACLVALASAFDPTTQPNMNGEYKISKTPGATGEFPTDFKDFPGGVESFDVYHGPIKTVYSQVYWTSTSVPLPKDIVDRFDGKVMAIVGLEIDQVRKTSEGDVSVPITMAYNHHHDTAVVGKAARLEKVKLDRSDPRIGDGHDFIRLDHGQAWIAVENEPSGSQFPTSAMFSDANGGEYRKSFHALPPPFAQLVESPQQLAGSPMQIDTWNRDKMNLTGYPHFVPGPVPRHNLAPTSGPDAIYSGLLECPLTTRIEKIISNGNDSFSPQLFSCGGEGPQLCGHQVSNATECLAAVKQLAGLTKAQITSKVVTEDTLPPGCTVTIAKDASRAVATFNTAPSKVCCGSKDGLAVAGTTSSLVHVSLHLTPSNATVTITLSGPDQVWFGVGFNATLMSDEPYTLVVDGSGTVSEHKLANHAPGTELATSVTVLSNTVSSGVRTVVVSRPLKGKTPDHYDFDPNALDLNIIDAVGSTPTLSYHKAKTTANIALWPVDGAPACVCKRPAAPFGQATGSIKYLPTGETIGFPNKCPPQPRGDLLAQQNPTCDIRTYAGGLSTCHNGWLLLDADQEIPWQDQPLEYYKKFRIYFQEYNATFHKQIMRHDWGIGADRDYAEYDVPQCPQGTPTEKCTHAITGTWMPVPASSPNIHLVAAHFHCHAPTCLRVEMWNNDTGALLCRQEPLYGGTGSIDDPRFDEPGYIATPPCLWGSPEHGLEPPPLVSGMTIHVISVTNNTFGHHGEMALPEVSLVQM